MKQALLVINVTDLKACMRGDGYAFGISVITENKICFAFSFFLKQTRILLSTSNVRNTQILTNFCDLVFKTSCLRLLTVKIPDLYISEDMS